MTFRNRALLDLCHEAPCLLLPGQHECLGPPSEPCHSDMIRHGRGEHHKSHDCFAVPGCHNAHLAFTRSNLGKEGYFQAWVETMERFILWLWVAGKIRLADIMQRTKEHTMEAPKCKICDHNHWAREPHILPANAPAEKRSTRTLPSSGLNVHASSVSPAKSQPVRRASEAGNSALTAGVTARRDGKNTSREGRDVVKPKGTSTERDHRDAQPATATPGKPAGKKGQRRAAKPTPGKRKPRTNKKIVDAALRALGDIAISDAEARLRLPSEKVNNLRFGRWPEAKTKAKKKGKKKCAQS